MTVVDLTPTLDGYAQVLRAVGDLSLLSLHLDGAPPPDRAARIYFAIARGEELLFATSDARAATVRFDDLRSRMAAVESEDFLATQPMSLPAVRGDGFRSLVSQLSQHLLEDEGS